MIIQKPKIAPELIRIIRFPEVPLLPNKAAHVMAAIPDTVVEFEIGGIEHWQHHPLVNNQKYLAQNPEVEQRSRGGYDSSEEYEQAIDDSELCGKSLENSDHR